MTNQTNCLQNESIKPITLPKNEFFLQNFGTL